MNKWFSLGAYEMSQAEKSPGYTLDKQNLRRKYPYIDDSMFDMEWLCKFERVQIAKNELISTLETPLAIDAITESITNHLTKYQVSNEGVVKTYDGSIMNLHSDWQFQSSGVDYDNGVDDLYGSLGAFGLYAAVLEFAIKEENNTQKCQITKIGIYMKDTYDFIGAQYLGHWNYFGLYLDLISGGMNKVNTERKSDVIDPIIGEARSFGNEDFRNYRKETGKGCDLYLFSDIIEVDVNIEIDL